MSPYRSLLGIETSGRPNLFQLLGVSESETDPQAIKDAANSQIQKLRSRLEGPQGALCRQLAAEVKDAYKVLANPSQRGEYLAELLTERDEETVSNVLEEKGHSSVEEPSNATSNRVLIVLGLVVGLMLLGGVGIVARTLLKDSGSTRSASNGISTAEAELKPADAVMPGVDSVEEKLISDGGGHR